MYCEGIRVVVWWRRIVDIWSSRNSVRGRIRIADEQAVPSSADFHCACLGRRRENDALTGRQHRHEADRRSSLALCERRDDAESIGLDRVIGDAGQIAEPDASPFDRLQTVAWAAPSDATVKAAARIVLR